MANNLSFAVALELVSTAFNQGMDAARQKYQGNMDAMGKSTQELSAEAKKAQAALQSIVMAGDSRAISQGFVQATQALKGLESGLSLSTAEMKQFSLAQRQAMAELRAELIKARSELSQLVATRAPIETITAARQRVTELATEVSTARATYQSFQAAAVQAMQRAEIATQASTAAAKNAGSAIYGMLNIRSSGAIQAEINAINQALAQFRQNANASGSELSRVMAAGKASIASLRAEMSGIPSTATSASQGLSGVASSLTSITGTAVGMAAVAAGLKTIFDTTKQFEGLQKQMEYSIPATQKVAESMQYTKDVANKLGLDVVSTTEGFIKFAAATKGTSLEGQATKDVFEGVSAAAATMGMSSYEASLTFQALSQIAGKGRVQLEELRGQLAERFPPAMVIAAKSMGVTQSRLMEMISAGLDAGEFLGAFGRQLQEEFSETALKNVNSLPGKINLVSNAFIELQLSASRMGLDAMFAGIIEKVTSLLNTASTGMAGLDSSTKAAVSATLEAVTQLFGSTIGTVIAAVSTVHDLLSSVTTLIASVISGFLGLNQSTEQVGLLTRALQGVSILIGALGDGVDALGITFTLVSGIGQKVFADLARILAKFTFGSVSVAFRDMYTQLDKAGEENLNKAETMMAKFNSKTVAALDKAAGESEKSENRISDAAVKSADTSSTAHAGAATKVAASHDASATKASASQAEIATAAKTTATSTAAAHADAATKIGASYVGMSPAINATKEALTSVGASGVLSANRVMAANAGLQTSQENVAAAAKLYDAAMLENAASQNVFTAGTKEASAQMLGLTVASTDAATTIAKDYISVASSTATAAGSFKVMETAGQAAIRAVNEAAKAGADGKLHLEAFAGKGGQLVVDTGKQVDSIREVITKMAGEVGLQLPPAAMKFSQMGEAMAVAIRYNDSLAASIGKKLPEAIASLKPDELVKFRDTFVDSMERAGVSSTYVKDRTIEMATALVSAFGGELTSSLTSVSAQFNRNMTAVNGLAADLKNLKAVGIDTGKMLEQSMAGVLSTAKNEAEINTLIAAWKRLGAEGKVTGTQMAFGIAEAKAKANELTPTIVEMTTKMTKAIGTDIVPALKVMSMGFENNITRVDALASQLDVLKKQGIDTGKMISLSMSTMLESAKNQAEVTKLIDMWRKLGSQGKVTGEDLRAGLQAANAKLDELKPGINSLNEAFKTMGMQTRAEAQKIAKQYGDAYDMMRASGQLTTEQLREAFKKYATASIAANGGVADSMLAIKAQQLDLNVTVSRGGEIVIQSTKEVMDVAKQHKDSILDLRDVDNEVSKTINTNLEEEIALRDRATAATDAQASADSRRGSSSPRGMGGGGDSGGGGGGGSSGGASGGTSESGDNWMSIYTTLKNYGMDEGTAKRTASEFVSDTGIVVMPTKYRKNQYETLSQLVMNAGQAYIQSRGSGAGSGVGVGTSANATSSPPTPPAASSQPVIPVPSSARKAVSPPSPTIQGAATSAQPFTATASGRTIDVNFTLGGVTIPLSTSEDNESKLLQALSAAKAIS